MLSRSVTLRHRKAPLSRILAEVSRETGVPLSASAEIADEPATVYVTNRPAAEVLRQLALLFNYQWARRGSGDAATWQLYQDLQSRREEEALRDGGRAEALASVQAEIRKDLAAAAEDSAPHRGALLRTVSLLRPEHWQELAEGGILYLSVPREPGSLPLPPEIAAGLRPRFYGENEAVRPLAGWRIRLSLDLQQRSGRWSAELRADASGIPEQGSVGLTPLGVSDLHLHASSIPRREERSVPGDAASHASGWMQHPLLGRVRQWLAPDNSPDRDGRAWQPYEAAYDLAERYGADVIADAYHQPILGLVQPEPREYALYSVLQSWGAPTYRWRTSDAVDAMAPTFLLLRSRAWYSLRRDEVPERVVKHWAGQLAGRRTLTLDDVVSLALTLNDGQLQQLPARLEDEGLQLSSGIEQPELLRWYGSLLPSQQAQLPDGAELPYARWPEAAKRHWRTLERRFRLGRLAEPPPPPPNGRIRMRQHQVQLFVLEQSPRQTRYEFRVQGPEENGRVVASEVINPTWRPGFVPEDGRLTEVVRFEYRDGERQYYPQLLLPYVSRLPKPVPAPEAEPGAP